MGRWEPNAVQRLQQAAWKLFAERGYADVTVTEIAERAGLTKRSFFNHFADKREVLFAGAQGFEADILGYLAETDADAEPIDAAIAALTRGGLDLTPYREPARIRRGLIASSTELQERNLIKMASLTAAIAEALGERRVPARTAAFAAQAAVAAFDAAYDDWAADATADFSALMRQALSDLRHAVDAAHDEEPPQS
ncbi:TetR/AcrR family transcriptional regulator [Catenulispora sp. NF23]|uniref:TetR/AcrR family transcriptional regulator n=1 Tax=Catenulispora pinistramenti TaxID=2705254 RepID=A0ABS5KID2_9ACTN|nr:TetR/AcrR family transcriptional regulator [Catenulispora pinistramenti]MBS2538496.1 TetR/AcrR family transcriptional regulator [Catenulispora pinistramenti]MBS2545630.1 TetR/AcrR family transcriptional regulator [Catenulispora pinistramenti]